MTTHACPYPASGCTDDECQVTLGRFDDRVVEALVRIDHKHRITCIGLGEVGCAAYSGWHSWTEHRRHTAEAQLAELRRCHLIESGA